MTTQPPLQLKTGIVKQVHSGDTIILRGPPTKNGPPDNMTLILTGINAPKLGRRPDNNGEGATKDEPYAWEAREFLRKKLIGKRVWFTFEKGKQTPTEQKGPKREYGIVYVGPDTSSENVAESLVLEGLVEVRTQARNNEYVQKLAELENIAKAAGKGKHGTTNSEHIRDIRWSIENLHNFKDSFHQKPIKAIIEHVVDGSTVRALLYSDDFPEYYYIKLMLSGIRCNGFTDKGAEPLAEEAKFFTECRLLQRDVEILLESVSNKNFLGSVLHPNGNITECLLREGFAKCVDWSLQCVTSGIEALRAAEKEAKEKRLRIWKDYTPSGIVIDAKDKEFQGKVIEVINGDAMVVKLADGSTKKIFLASIRPPRLQENSSDPQKPKTRALYDIPYMFEAREFLRKKLIGKKVNVVIDYKQPANGNFPEKICCTVTIGGINVAEALVGKGLATVLRYRADDDQRSAHYDDLLSAETKAVKSGKGLHKKDSPVHRIVDLAGDLKSSKQYFPIIQRGGKMEAIVEFVTSGSRLRIYLPRQSYLLTFLLGGINCQKPTRDTPNNSQPGDPFGDEALAFTKDLCLQKEVQIEAEAMDKAGNFIGWMWVDGCNLSELLVKEGFAEVHPTAARSPYSRALTTAQEEAQKKKLKMWEKWAPVEIEHKEEAAERAVKYVKVDITNEREEPTSRDLLFSAILTEDVAKTEEMNQQLKEDIAANPPVKGAFHPKKGELIAATYLQFQNWHRARVIKIEKNSLYLNFIDIGIRLLRPTDEIAPLPSKFASIPPYAQEYGLAFVKLPNDPDLYREIMDEFAKETLKNNHVWLNQEYSVGSITYATLATLEEKDDIGKWLVETGMLFADKRREKRFQKIISEYQSAQESAKKNRLNLWMYGDITEDDAKEFG